MIVEMRPEVAPKAVERIKLLARERVYDGLQFHRVVEGFVAQTGNPNNKDGGASRHPDLPAEFTFRVPRSTVAEVYNRSDGIDGLIGSVPVSGEVTAAGEFRGWGAYCTGVAGMGRQADPSSSNSEIFFMLAPERRLDHEYSVWGRVVAGAPVLERLNRGEPPATPDLMTRVRVAADLPTGERPRVELPAGPALTRSIETVRASKSANASICDLGAEARIVQ